MYRCDIPELDLDWIIPGKLAALARPSEGDLPRLAKLGIKLLVSLNEDPPSSQAVIAAGMTPLRLPFDDYTAPTQELIDTFVQKVTEHLDRGEPVAVHCLAGVGRTGTMIACYLVSQGYGPYEAIEYVRARRYGSVESGAQKRAVVDYWRRLHPPGTVVHPEG